MQEEHLENELAESSADILWLYWHMKGKNQCKKNNFLETLCLRFPNET